MAIHLTDTCDGGALSIEGGAFGAGLQISPVPASDVLRVMLPVAQGYFTVVINDINGRRVFHKNVIAPGTTEMINVDAFPAGLYFLELSDNEGNAAFRKIIISH
jgi:hypothetical protein